MKLNPVSICLWLVLAITVVKAQRMFKINRPIVDLNSRPQITTTPKLPEERRKLSIFPKSMAKFVVTSNPYSKVRTYSPWEVSTKRPVMQKLFSNEMRTSKMAPVTKSSLIHDFTSSSETSKRVDEASNRRTENQHLIMPNDNENTPRLSKINNQFVSKDIEPEAEGTNEVSTASLLNSAKVNQITSTESSATTEADLEISRQKRLSIRGLGEYNIVVPNKSDVYSTGEQKDNNEFIFLKEKLGPMVNTRPSNIIGIEEDMEIATEIVWLEDYSKLREKRSVNIIEEENLGTTVSGFKFTGREPRVNSHLAFKNINA